MLACFCLQAFVTLQENPGTLIYIMIVAKCCFTKEMFLFLKTIRLYNSIYISLFSAYMKKDDNQVGISYYKESVNRLSK